MAISPNLTLLANAMKMEKEIFWIANRNLPANERERRWTAHTAELTSVLGAAAPIESLVIEEELNDSKAQQKQQAAGPLFKNTVHLHDPSFVAMTLLHGLLEADFGIGCPCNP